MDLNIWKIPVVFLNRTQLPYAAAVRIIRDPIKHVVKIGIELDNGTWLSYNVIPTTSLEICRCSKAYYSLGDKDWLAGVELPQQAHWLRVIGLKDEKDKDIEIHFAWYLMRDWARLQRLAGQIVVEEKVKIEDVKKGWWERKKEKLKIGKK